MNQEIPTSFIVNGNLYSVIKLLGHGKGGYSYLVTYNNSMYVLKKIHHEPCSYYNFGNKLESELNDYEKLRNTELLIPKMIELDKDNEIIIKEYIDGETIFEKVKNGENVSAYIKECFKIQTMLEKHNINIDYFPTNFVVKNNRLFYIDYECNDYLPEWDFTHWGIKYWRKSKEFYEYLQNNI